MPLTTPQTRQLYGVIAQHFPRGTIAAYDRDLRYLIIDGQAIRELGIDPESLTGQMVGSNIEDEQTRLELQEHARAVFSDEQFHFEHDIDGRHYRFDFVPVKIDQIVQYGLVVVYDMTEEIALKNDLKISLEQTKNALQVRDKFMAIAAHELKTPLTTIIGYTQLIASKIRDRLDDREQKMLQNVLIQEAKLNNMISSLLDLTRIEHGTLSLRTGPMDVVILVRDVMVDMRFNSEHHTFLEEYTRDSVIIEGDQDRLEQVFRNIIMNAIKYSPGGGPISVSVRKLQNEVTVTVTDPGIGIPRNELSRIFEEFSRGSNLSGTTNTQISGMGIGLFVSREIVHMHDGAIYAASEGLGHGSCFTVILPLRKSNDTA